MPLAEPSLKTYRLCARFETLSHFCRRSIRRVADLHVDAVASLVVADENDFDSERFPGNFYQGMILKLDRARGRGVVRSHSGKEIPFEFPFVAVVGAPIGGTMPGIDLIRE